MRVYFRHRLLRARDFQARSELDRLCDWWRSGGRGVCSLVGIGGAGKTAMLDRFLRLLPGVMEKHPLLPKDVTLPAPAGVFVFSFYREGNPEAFFNELDGWLESLGVAPSALWISAAEGTLLLVLDGLERVQEETPGTAFGKIGHSRLRDLVLRVAEGFAKGISLVVTSRFVLDDLLYRKSPCHRAISVERLTSNACVRLLRGRGVRGTWIELARIAENCGLHALTVDLVAGYIAYFGKGDPKTPLYLPTAEEFAQAVDSSLDRERRYVAEQSVRLAKVAKLYREALTRTDPAALALLERVCLFRWGVDGKDLAAIFTGDEKTEISGPELAVLRPDELELKLSFLAEMRLLEPTEPAAGEAHSDTLYTVHPAVRDGFLRQLDAKVAMQGHQAVHDAWLGGLPGVHSNPTDPAALRRLEEIVHQTLEAAHPQEAFDIYWSRIGAYGNLGWRLGDYERGERICHAFLASRPSDSASPPKGLSKASQVLVLKEQALYLEALGQLDMAVELCVEHNNYEHDSRSASVGHQILAGFHLLRGRLNDGMRAAGQALKSAEGHSGERYSSLALLAYAKMLQGNTPSAMWDFEEAERLLTSPRQIDALPGLWRALLFARLGRFENARTLMEANLEVCRSYLGKENAIAPKCNLLLADLACAVQDFATARRLLTCVEEWISGRAAQEPLVWAALVRARILVGEAGAGLPDRSSSLREALATIEQGISLSRDCGYGLHHIDLLVLRAEVYLLLGEVEKAERSTHAALFGLAPPLPGAGDYGFSPREERAPSKLRLVSPRGDSGLPELLAATHDDCGYAWGEGDARFILAEALLSRAAKLYGQSQFDPAQRTSLATPIQVLIEKAAKQLQICLELRRRIQDPKAAVTQERIEQLQAGILKRVLHTETPLVDKEAAMMKNMPPEERPRVFVSHSSEDNRFVQRLLEDLKSRGLPVWLDDVELKAGDSIVEEISKGLRDTDYLVIVLSQASTQSLWVRAELNAALMRQFSGKGTIVLPAVIEDCEIPILLQDRKFADFRRSYEEGLQTLLNVLEHETVSASDLETSLSPRLGVSLDCKTILAALKLAALRRMLAKRLSRPEISIIWFDLFETRMDDDMAGRALSECIVELLDRAKKRNLLPQVLEILCDERPDLREV